MAWKRQNKGIAAKVHLERAGAGHPEKAKAETDLQNVRVTAGRKCDERVAAAAPLERAEASHVQKVEAGTGHSNVGAIAGRGHEGGRHQKGAGRS